MPDKIGQLEALASDMVGDGGTPDVFFVSDEGTITLVATDFETAYAAWRQLAARYPARQCDLEDREWGCICAVEPATDAPGARLVVFDSSDEFKRRDVCSACGGPNGSHDSDCQEDPAYWQAIDHEIDRRLGK